MRKPLVALAAVVAIAGCAREEAPPVAAAEPEPVVEPQPVADFTATIYPPDAPGVGALAGRALWTMTRPQTGGGVGANPALSIQLRTTSNFVVQTSPAVGSCTERYITAPVEITNYFPERLVNPYVAFSWISNSANALCASGAVPNVLQYDSGAPPSYGLGVIRYTPNVGVALHGSPQVSTGDPTCPACVSPAAGGLGARSASWTFNYVTEVPFRVAGRVFAELYPAIPAITSPAAPPLRFGSTGQLPIDVWVNAGSVGDATAPYVKKLKAEICEGTASGCTGPVETYIVPRAGSTNSSFHIDEFAISNELLTTGENDGPPLEPGTQYLMKLYAYWDITAVKETDGSGVWMQSTTPLEKAFSLVGTIEPLAPANDTPIGDGDTLTWRIDRPDPARDQPNEWGVAPGALQICSGDPGTAYTQNCSSPHSVLFTAYDTGTLRHDRFITAQTVDGVVTYTFTADFDAWPEGAAPTGRPAPGTVGYWRVRNQYADNFQSRWTPARKILFGMKPTSPDASSPDLTFSLDDRNATSVFVELCGDASCTSVLASGDATGGSGSYAFDSDGLAPRPFWWRARAVYLDGDGPWGEIWTAP